VVGNGKKISLKDLPLGKTIVNTTVESLDDLEKNHIYQILSKYNWNISVSNYLKLKNYLFPLMCRCRRVYLHRNIFHN
jgi:hypothetical protein